MACLSTRLDEEMGSSKHSQPCDISDQLRVFSAFTSVCEHLCQFGQQGCALLSVQSLSSCSLYVMQLYFCCKYTPSLTQFHCSDSIFTQHTQIPHNRHHFTQTTSPDTTFSKQYRLLTEYTKHSNHEAQTRSTELNHYKGGAFETQRTHTHCAAMQRVTEKHDHKQLPHLSKQADLRFFFQKLAENKLATSHICILHFTKYKASSLGCSARLSWKRNDGAPWEEGVQTSHSTEQAPGATTAEGLPESK